MASDSSMEWTDTLRERVDRDHLVVGWLVPGGAAVGAMALGFVVVAVLLLTNEPLVTGSGWQEGLALATMFLFPHLAAGLWFGRRHGPAVGPPVAAGFAPVVVLILALALHGGPVLTPFLVPAVALGAVATWAAVFAVGMVVSARVTPVR
jgi:hypothetical protein